MRSWKAPVAAALTTVAFGGFATTGSAATTSYSGFVAGQTSPPTVDFDLVKKNGQSTVKNFAVGDGTEVFCSDGPSTIGTFSFKAFRVKRNRWAGEEYSESVTGDIGLQYLRGSLTNRGAAAEGRFSLTLRFSDGSECSTGFVEWTAFRK